MWDNEFPPQGYDSRSRTRRSLVLDRLSCPLGKISLFHWCITEYSINRNCRHYLKRTDIILFWICVCHLLLFI